MAPHDEQQSRSLGFGTATLQSRNQRLNFFQKCLTNSLAAECTKSEEVRKPTQALGDITFMCDASDFTSSSVSCKRRLHCPHTRRRSLHSREPLAAPTRVSATPCSCTLCDTARQAQTSKQSKLRMPSSLYLVLSVNPLLKGLPKSEKLVS